MAQALKTVWLEPEEQQEPLVLQSRPQRRRQPVPVTPQRSLAVMGIMMLAIVCEVGMVSVYINAYARIAQYEYRRQALQQEYAQLNRDCIQMQLQIDNLAAQPHLVQVAQAQGLGLPNAGRLHCVRVTDEPQWSTLASAKTRPQPWLMQVRQQFVDVCKDAIERLERGPGTPAYAQ